MEGARVLVLGTVTAAELRKLGHWGVPRDELALAILISRPEVSGRLVDAIADETPTRWQSRFGLMRALVRTGAIERPTNPGYILAMINGLDRGKETVYDALKADPHLLDDEVWRLFEVEGAGENSLATHDKYSPEANSWSRALTMLVADGQLSRNRLLDASLAALRRDFAPFRAGWFSRFHEALCPTRDERREREGDYVALLASPVAATVSFAIKGLRAAGGVTDGAIDRLGPALEARAITTVTSATKLLPRSARGAAMAAKAIPRATRDGQAMLLAFLARVEPLGPEASNLLSAATPDLPPALRDEAVGLLGPAARIIPDRAPAVRRATSPRSMATGVAGPVQSLAELVELLATLLERVENVHDLERAIDGVSRLCDRSDDTLRRLAAVARRPEKILAARGQQPFAGRSPRADIAGLIVAWASGQGPSVPPLGGSRLQTASTTPDPARSVLGFLSYRVMEVAARAARGRPEPVLSLPTAAGGAIDPAVLAERREGLRRGRIRPADADAVQAALRAGEIQPHAVTFRFGSEQTSHTADGKTYRFVHVKVVVEPRPATEPTLEDVPDLFLAAIPEAVLRRTMADYCGVGSDGPAGLREAVAWVATVWPGNREPFYAKGAIELGQNINWFEARWHARHFLDPLLLPSEPIGAMARLLLALALGAKEPGERALATDVLIAGITQARLDAAFLGAVLGSLYDQGVLKGSRLAPTLADAARISDRHAEGVVTIIEHTLAALHGPPPPDLHGVLHGLRDLLATQHRPLRLHAARAYLAGIEGTSKAAAAARKLLALA